MSGIAGIYDTAAPGPSPEALLAMAVELRHRGPDGVGLYLDRGFGMVHARLAVGHSGDTPDTPPPASNEAGQYWVVHDGAIYNAPELRAELRSRGHHFATNGDAELLAHAYEEWGADSLPRLNGQFAFALWDRTRAELFLARDRFGSAPLFLTMQGGSLAFASEAKALLLGAGTPRELDPLGVVESFALWACAPDRSAFAGIRELPGGHFLRCGAAGICEERRWWELPLGTPGEARDPDELAEELVALLEDAVRIRLRDGAPAATYLSGGLDSSALTALAARIVGRPLPAFAIGFADQRFDESAAQDQVAGALGAELRRITITEREVAESLPRVVELAEKPTLRTAPAPLLRLSAVARAAGARVVLTGEGADELFGGYDIFKLDRVRRFWARHPDSTLRPRLLHSLYGFLPHDLHRAGALLRETFRGGLTETADPLYSHRPRFDRAERLLGYFDPDFLERARKEGEPTERLRARLPEGFARWSDLERAQYLEITTFLCGYLLHAQGDRMSLGNSVEGRLPFLDHRVAEFAARLPDGLRLRGLQEKYLLRRAVAPLLPAAIARRKKRPYRAPIVAALAGPDAPAYVQELTRPARLAEAGVFRAAPVERLLAKCRRNAGGIVGEGDEMALVGICSVMLLHERFIARPRPGAAAGPTRVVIGARVRAPDSLHLELSYEELATATPA